MNATSGWIRWLVMAILLGHVAMAAAQAPANRNKGRAAADAVSANRIALVIGNASYRAIPLSNPVNDARLVSGNLRKLGFQVEEHLNLNVRDFRRVLRDFARKMNSDGDGVALFYYAGHGMQIDGRNYLLPVDLNLRDEEEVKDDAVDIEDIFIRRVDRPDGKARVVILDACRDNPFGARTRNIRASSGLAEMAARGTLIAYASAPGAPAEDGPTGTNSIYTRHLAEEMIKPGLEIEQMFKNVRVKVLRDTNQRQTPWVNTSLTVNFSFNPVTDGSAQVADAGRIDRLQAELEETRRRLEEAERAARGPGAAGDSAAAASAVAPTAAVAAAGRTTAPDTAAAARPAGDAVPASSVVRTEPAPDSGGPGIARHYPGWNVSGELPYNRGTSYGGVIVGSPGYGGRPVTPVPAVPSAAQPLAAAGTVVPVPVPDVSMRERERRCARLQARAAKAGRLSTAEVVELRACQR